MLDAFTLSRLERIATPLPFQLRENSKLYVSKSRIVSGGRFLGEGYIETVLEQDGFITFHPQNYTFVEQMLVYKSADHILFNEGSACHGVELFGRNVLGDVCVMMRRTYPYRKQVINEIFRPRCRQVQILEGNPYVGTVAVDRKQGAEELMHHLGVSIINPGALKTYLEHNKLGSFRTFSWSDYIEYAAKDLEAYLSFYSNNNNIRNLPEEGRQKLRDEFQRIARMRMNI